MAQHRALFPDTHRTVPTRGHPSGPPTAAFESGIAPLAPIDVPPQWTWRSPVTALNPTGSQPASDRATRRGPLTHRETRPHTSVVTGIAFLPVHPSGIWIAHRDYSESRRCGKAGSIRSFGQLVLGVLLGLFTTGCASLTGRPWQETTLTKSMDSTPVASAPINAPPLRIAGRHFVDATGPRRDPPRRQSLRRLPRCRRSRRPPAPPTSTSCRDLGFNVIRLLFLWEAYEPVAGRVQRGYLGELRAVAAAARERGISTIVDFHQDGFSRHASRGAGDGFPRWAVSPRGRLSKPDNGPAARTGRS